MSIYDKVTEALGSRRYHLTQDQYQIFWIGVMKALKDVDTDRDIIPYLILRGFGEVKNDRRSQFSKKYYKYCPDCGTVYVFRKNKCNSCDGELKIDSRYESYEDELHHHYEDQNDVLNKVMLQDFVGTLSGRKQYIAKRWLVDRADLMHDNHLKQIGFELGISAVAVANHKKKIKQRFLHWYHTHN